MNLTFEKKGRITLGEQEQSNKGSFCDKFGAGVERETDPCSGSEDGDHQRRAIGEFSECNITFVFTDSFNNPRLSISDISPLKK